jgi:ribonuclease J
MSNQKPKKEHLIYLPLGGSNEIGMNVNLYHYNGKWIIIDLGAGFAGDEFPGVDMVAPDLSFVYENRKDFLGIVLTHGHEDHLGAVGYLHDQLNLPIYCTPFTSEIVKNKLEQTGALKRAKINIIKPGSNLKLGDFDLQMVQITHSIPEMNGILVKTPAGNVFHTGDWKFDPNPVVKPSTDFDTLKKIGDQGVTALVCDSTNVFNDRFSGSEGELLPHLKGLIKAQKGRVYVTTFASNVARIETICKAAKACGRRVALAGMSLAKITEYARNTGYLKDIEPFISDKEVNKMPRDRVLVICTGCQGEERAAISKIAGDNHPTLRLTPDDTVIFSSKIIPGNEKKIIALMNRFVRLRCEVFTEKDHFVHVSGHPSREELKRMYELIRPEIAIPTHGEPVHLHHHCKLARELGVKKAIETQNGEMIKIGPDGAGVLRTVKTGYLGVDGYMLQPKGGPVMSIRQSLRDSGIIMVNVTIDKKGELLKKPGIKTPGVLFEPENMPFISYLEEEVERLVDRQKDVNEKKLEKKIRKHVRGIIEKELKKWPMIEIFITRV